MNKYICLKCKGEDKTEHGLYCEFEKDEKKFIEETFCLDIDDLTEKGLESLRNSRVYASWKLRRSIIKLGEAIFDTLPKFIQKIIKRRK